MTHMDVPLCEDCVSLLQLIDGNERCPLCFSSHYCPLQNICAHCDYLFPSVNRMAASFDYEGPASTLIRKLKYGDAPHLAEGLGAMMVTQLFALNWPIPDVIVPVPISLARWIERGYNQSQLLSDSIGHLVNVPVVNALGRKSGDFSQAGLSRQQRMTLDGRSLYLKNSNAITGKVVLLVDDVLTTGSTMNRCAEVLWEESPLAIYALAFCKAV
jgi:competence protein ComFC